MKYLNAADYSVIGVYFLILVALGIWLSRRASASLEDYFLGGRKLPWWLLGVSGMASQLDVAGTMLIVSFLFLLGPQGLFIEFRGGAVLILPVLMLWTGKWNRRSNCMTGAEWMEYRFGGGVGGQFARVVTALAVMIGVVGALAYLTKAAGLYLSMFLPFSPLVCAAIMITIGMVYTMASGFYGVVYTDLFQSVIILGAVIVVTLMAVTTTHAYPMDLDELAASVTGAANWTSAAPATHVAMPRGYEDYSPLLLFATFYLLKNIVQGAGMGQDAKYYGARSERECGTLTFFWTCLMTMRWPMMMGFAVLGLFLVYSLFPDRQTTRDTVGLVKTHPEFVAAFGEDVPKARWNDYLAQVIHDPLRFPTLTEKLQSRELLGRDWETKLKLVSYEGEVNPERILPAVLLYRIPIGLRGLLLVALLAASMSTFDTSLNQSAAYFTRDLYQRYWRPGAPTRELMLVTYAYILLVVALGFWMAYGTETINEIWAWLTMGLWGGLLAPGILKFYWWRFNAGGVVYGTLVGLAAAVTDRLYNVAGLLKPYFPEAMSGELVGFTWAFVMGAAGAILGTYLTAPAPRATLEHFYRTTRPFGAWGPLKRTLPESVRRATTREHRNDLIALPFAVAWQITLFLLPMLAVIGNWPAFRGCLLIFAVGLAGLYWFWYRNLPPAEAGVLDSVESVAALERQRASLPGARR